MSIREKVQGNSNLVRDRRTRAVLNTDRGALNKARAKKYADKRLREDFDDLKKRFEQLERIVLEGK